MMKPVRYDRHAKRRMEERGVAEEEVEVAMKEPEHLESSIKGRRNAYRFIGGRFLRVTFKEEVNHMLVITVTVRRRPFKE
jgi:hypothetical protein